MALLYNFGVGNVFLLLIPFSLEIKMHIHRIIFFSTNVLCYIKYTLTTFYIDENKLIIRLVHYEQRLILFMIETSAILIMMSYQEMIMSGHKILSV